MKAAEYKNLMEQSAAQQAEEHAKMRQIFSQIPEDLAKASTPQYVAELRNFMSRVEQHDMEGLVVKPALLEEATAVLSQISDQNMNDPAVRERLSGVDKTLRKAAFTLNVQTDV
jgi:uncharacterized protein YecE (DUF72 family)